MQVIESDISE